MKPVINKVDIYRAANVLMQHHGDKAQDIGRGKAFVLEATGEQEGAAIWMQIVQAVAELEDACPRDKVIH